jgi:type 1 glutamine amidotransferase
MTEMVPELILVVTATVGFRHSSIETAEELLTQMAPRIGYQLEFARDEPEISAAFDHLDRFKAVMFVNTTGDLRVDRRERLLDWVRGGGSFVGVHSASDTWHEWPEYIEMLGGEFDFHPDQTTGTLVVEARNHPATGGLDSPYDLFEEFYRFRNFTACPACLLLTLREGSETLPMAWSRNYGAGRVFYTALGHREDVWTSEWFGRHIAGAIQWSLRRDLLPRRRAVRSAP